MTGLPKITVITPSYNQGRYIEKTIQSVLLQDYPFLEYIILDGGSTDETLHIIKKYEHRLQWASEKDRGQSHAINKGMKMATGEVIGFINTDDVYMPGALNIIGKYFSMNPSAMWVTGRCRNINSEGKEIRKVIALYKDFWLWWNSPTVLKVLNYISQPATFWRRKIVMEVGYLDESLHFAMEYDFWLRIFQKYTLFVIWKKLADFRIHPASKAGSSANAQFDAELEIARRYVRSPLLLFLHTLHRAIVVATYRQMLGKENDRRNTTRLI